MEQYQYDERNDRLHRTYNNGRSVENLNKLDAMTRLNRAISNQETITRIIRDSIKTNNATLRDGNLDKEMERIIEVKTESLEDVLEMLGNNRLLEKA